MGEAELVASFYVNPVTIGPEVHTSYWKNLHICGDIFDRTF
jgi:hypothetical protein